MTELSCMTRWLSRFRASEPSSVVVDSNPTQANSFYSYFKESSSGEYHIYQLILLYTFM